MYLILDGGRIYLLVKKIQRKSLWRFYWSFLKVSFLLFLWKFEASLWIINSLKFPPYLIFFYRNDLYRLLMFFLKPHSIIFRSFFFKFYILFFCYIRIPYIQQKRLFNYNTFHPNQHEEANINLELLWLI